MALHRRSGGVSRYGQAHGRGLNLACTYCFYLSKATLYPGSRLRMTDAVLEVYIRQLLVRSAPRGHHRLAGR